MLLTLVLSLLTCVSCSEETLDYNNPDVDLFVRQLKAGNYNTKSPKGFVEVPKFTEKDIPDIAQLCRRSDFDHFFSAAAGVCLL